MIRKLTGGWPADPYRGAQVAVGKWLSSQWKQCYREVSIVCPFRILLLRSAQRHGRREMVSSRGQPRRCGDPPVKGRQESKFAVQSGSMYIVRLWNCLHGAGTRRTRISCWNVVNPLGRCQADHASAGKKNVENQTANQRNAGQRSVV